MKMPASFWEVGIFLWCFYGFFDVFSSIGAKPAIQGLTLAADSPIKVLLW
jgi:hypothetical protein